MDVLRPPDWMPNDYGLDRALVEPAGNSTFFCQLIFPFLQKTVDTQIF